MLTDAVIEIGFVSFNNSVSKTQNPIFPSVSAKNDKEGTVPSSPLARKNVAFIQRFLSAKPKVCFTRISFNPSHQDVEYLDIRYKIRIRPDL